MTMIKICGIRNVEDALAAVAAGADYVGVVLAPSPRQVKAETAGVICRAVHMISPRAQTVGVFVNRSADDVNRFAQENDLDYVQLSGDEDWDFCRQIVKPVIKVIHITDSTTRTGLTKEIEKGYDILSGKSFFCLLDSRNAGIYGGTGKMFDWGLIRDNARKYPLFVAGGLNTTNVESLIKQVNPWAVDVSSGVEIDGFKSPLLMMDFVASTKKFSEDKRNER